MADDLNPSPTSEISGNKETTANNSDKKSENQPKQEIQPRQRKARKWFGLSKTEWRELAAIVMLIPWVWYDLLDSHNFGKLCLLAISLVIAQGVVFSFLKSRWKALALWLISLIPVAGIVWENSRPIIEPHSHFTFFISTPDSNKIGLTNDLLIVKKANEFHAALGFLYVPIDDSQSNLSLKIDAQNDSASTAENVEIGILVPNDWLCVPDNGWMPVEQIDPSFSVMKYASGFVETNSIQVWVIRSPFPLLGGDGIVTPSIHLKRIHTFIPMSGIMCITAKAKDLPFCAVNFRLCILPKSFLKQHDSNKLFVSTAPIFNPPKP